MGVKSIGRREERYTKYNFECKLGRVGAFNLSVSTSSSANRNVGSIGTVTITTLLPHYEQCIYVKHRHLLAATVRWQNHRARRLQE